MFKHLPVKYFFIVFLFNVSSNIFAQFTPFIYNFPIGNLEITGQNWDISKSKEGLVYVANGNGLLSYNGIRWELNQLPNKTTVRSVLAVDSKIFTGSYQEFGYWEKNVFGNLQYTSITQAHPEIIFHNEEFWQIISLKEDIYFRSFYGIYRYSNDKLESIVAPSTVISLNVVQDKVWVSTLFDGIFVINNSKLEPYYNSPVLNGKKIISIQALAPNKMLICTELDGCYIFENGNLSSYTGEINDRLKKYQLNKFQYLPNHNMLFGTIQLGEYLTDPNGKILYHFYRKNGLENNTILSQFYDENQQLWLGLDNGFSLVDFKNSNLFYNDQDGILGAVYAVRNYKNQIYIGSNTGLYTLSKDGELHFIDGTQGHVWNLLELQGDLLCGHNSGTFKITGNKAEMISNQAGGWAMKKVPSKDNVYIQGTYSGLIRFEKEGNVWRTKRIGKIDYPIRFVEFENENTAWLAHSNRGLYKVKFNQNYDSIISIKAFNPKTWSDYKLRIYKLENDIVIKSQTGWFQYSPIQDSIIEDAYLNKVFGKSTYIASEDNLPYVVLKTPNNLDFRKKNDVSKSIFITDEYYKNRGLLNESSVNYYNDSLLSFNLKDGFMLINERKFNSFKDHLYAPQVDKVLYNNSAVKLNKNLDFNLPYNHSQLKIFVSSPKSDRYFIEYRFASSDSVQWQKLSGSVIEFNHLFSGENTLQIRASNNLNQHSSIRNVYFDVSPPWYKSTLAYIIYFLLFLATVYFLYQYNNKKIEKEQEELRRHIVKEQEEKMKEQQLDNEKKLMELKNYSLKKQVRTKSKDLANHSMALIRKNEALIEIKNAIKANKNDFKNSAFYYKIISKLDHSLGEKKEEWEVFENNFSQIHEDFFEILKEKHPNLNQRDLKLCAYIKMDLLTKEVAPLMNISTRGIETYKYRLKKKLKIPKEYTLNEYLHNIS